MKNINIIFILLFLTNSIGYSQITKISSYPSSSSYYINNQPETSTRVHSQYLNENWEQGSLQTLNNEIIANVFFRYNITYNRFEMRTIVDPSSISRIYSAGKVYIYAKYINDNEVDSGYFELQNEGESKLLVKYRINKIPARIGAFGHDSYQQIFTDYYIKYGDNPAIKIKLKKRSIIKSLPKNKVEISEYIKSERLNLRYRKNIIKLLRYYDSL